MHQKKISRREFVILGSVGSLAIASGSLFSSGSPVVSVVKIKKKNVKAAVEEAIDLLGGIDEVARNKHRIMLKPNLVNNDPRATTNPEVIRALAKLMKKAGKVVSIGEGSAAAPGFNADEEGVYKTTDPKILDPMQQFVFDELGYTELSMELDVPLVNLHTGEMVKVNVPDAYVYDEITVHKSLSEIDLLCSVPMMKTHVLASVTLGMKNLIGLYPGNSYCTVRSCVHDDGINNGSPGIAYEIIDMVKACTPELVVIDASTSMEGNGPSDGELVETNMIIAGTNPLATDMVAAHIMGFSQDEVPTFMKAIECGMLPSSLSEIEIRGEQLDAVQYAFVKPDIVPWGEINSWFGARTV
ncbi:DUF362 domain-containing protein [Bacteroidota bacterium]